MVRGRPITIFEARKIALDILAQAEQERLLFAEAEAQRGIELFPQAVKQAQPARRQRRKGKVISETV